MVELLKKVSEDVAALLGVRLEVDFSAGRAQAAPDGKALSGRALAAFIDHTQLKPEARPSDILRLCEEAREHGFASVCVNSSYVAMCREALAGTPVKVCTVVGFPLGAMSTAGKSAETAAAVDDGAQEIDMVLPIGRLRSALYPYVHEDIRAVVEAAKGNAVKVIIETALLDEEQKIAACLIAKAAGAHFVKTCTGFSGGAATVEDIALMRRVVGDSMGVKASGGIRDAATARALIAAGANRLGASGGVAIVRETLSKETY